jgi:hypothetical protein
LIDFFKSADARFMPCFAVSGFIALKTPDFGLIGLSGFIGLIGFGDSGFELVSDSSSTATQLMIEPAPYDLAKSERACWIDPLSIPTSQITPLTRTRAMYW